MYKVASKKKVIFEHVSYEVCKEWVVKNARRTEIYKDERRVSYHIGRDIYNRELFATEMSFTTHRTRGLAVDRFVYTLDDGAKATKTHFFHSLRGDRREPVFIREE